MNTALLVCVDVTLIQFFPRSTFNLEFVLELAVDLFFIELCIGTLKVKVFFKFHWSISTPVKPAPPMLTAASATTAPPLSHWRSATWREKQPLSQMKVMVLIMIMFMQAQDRSFKATHHQNAVYLGLCYQACLSRILVEEPSEHQTM